MKKNYLILILIVVCFSLQTKAQPSYCIPYSYCYYGDYLSNVSFSNINRSSGCDNLSGSGYSNITSPVGNVTQLASYTLTVTAGYYDGVTAWIDYNQDGVFDNSELILQPYAGWSSGVTIPLTALTGATRMRVVASQYYYNTNPCSYSFNGETEDYSINISAAPPCSGTPYGGVASASVSFSCDPVSGLVLDLSGILNSGLTFQWQSSPDSLIWTDIPGANKMQDTLLETFKSTTYFRCLTTCTASGLSAYSNGLTLPIPSSHYHPAITVTGALSRCQGSTPPTILTASPSSHYLWNTGETTQSITPDLTYAGYFTFWVNDPDSTTCNPTDSSDYKLLTIYPTPNIFRSNTDTLCIGNSVTLTGYSWFGDTTNVHWNTGATTASITVTTAGTYRVSIDGCLSADTAVVITNNKTYRPTITIHGNDTICDGTSVVLSANRNKHYLWNTGATTQSIFATGGFYGNLYTVINPDSNRCITASNSVTITSKPSPQISPNWPQQICPGSYANLSAYAWPYVGSHFLWSNGATTQNINVTLPGTYTVTMDGCLSLQPEVISYYCSAPYSVSGSPLTVVNHKITMRISWYGCGIGFQVMYRQVGSNGWTTVNVNSITSYLDVTNLKQGNYYECQVRSKCSSGPNTYSAYSNSIIFYVPVARLRGDENADEAVSYDFSGEGLFLFPNPVDENLNIHFRSGASSAQLRIFNITGQVIEEKTLSSEDGNYATVEDVTKLTSGIYFVMIVAGDENLSARFVKE